MTPKKLEPAPDLVDRCYESLLEAICAAQMTPDRSVHPGGTRRARLGVSRQPVLQALQILRRQGLIRRRRTTAAGCGSHR